MTVTYIGHSGFLLETEDAYFLFDYFKGTIPELKNNKSIIVFSSHRHHDHFNPEIFELIKIYPDIRYVLSYDIPLKRHLKNMKTRDRPSEKHLITKKNIETMLKLPNGKDLKISTFRSTDEGVAFLLEYDNKVYYHAGDLNCWDWKEEPKSYRNNMIQLYIREIQKMDNLKIDVAFVPLDPKLEETAYEGLEIFMEHTNPQIVFPMHCWGKYDIISSFLNKHPEYKEKIRMINNEGQIFNV